MSEAILFGLLGLGVAFLCGISLHLNQIRMHLATIAKTPGVDLRPIREFGDEVIVLRSALDRHFSAVLKAATRISETFEKIAAEMREMRKRE